MKRIYVYLSAGFFSIILVFLFLILFKKTIIFNASIFIDKNITDVGEINYVAYLIVDKNILIEHITSIKLEYKTGLVSLTNQVLAYNNGLIILKHINLTDLAYPNPKVIVYGQQISLLNYLLNSLY